MNYSLLYFLFLNNLICLVKSQIDLKTLFGAGNIFTPNSNAEADLTMALLRQQLSQQYQNEHSDGSDNAVAHGTPTNFNSVVHNVKTKNGEIEIQQWDQINPRHADPPLDASRPTPRSKQYSRWSPVYPNYIPRYGDHQQSVFIPEFDEEIASVPYRSYSRLRRPLRNREHFAVINPPKPRPLPSEHGDDLSNSKKSLESPQTRNDESFVIEEPLVETIVKKKDKSKKSDKDKKAEKHKAKISKDKKKEKGSSDASKHKENSDNEVPLEEASVQPLKNPDETGEDSKEKEDEDGDMDDADNDEDSEDEDDEGTKKHKKSKKTSKTRKNSKKNNKKKKKKQKKEDDDDDDDEDEEKDNEDDENGELVKVEGDIKVTKTIDGETETYRDNEDGERVGNDYNTEDIDFGGQSDNEKNEKDNTYNKCEASNNFNPTSTDAYNTEKPDFKQPPNLNGQNAYARNRNNRRKPNPKQLNGRQGKSKCQQFLKDGPLNENSKNAEIPGLLNEQTKQITAKGIKRNLRISKKEKKLPTDEKKSECFYEKDEYPIKCPAWKSAGYCESNQATRFLWCRKTCLCQKKEEPLEKSTNTRTV